MSIIEVLLLYSKQEIVMMKVRHSSTEVISERFLAWLLVTIVLLKKGFHMAHRMLNTLLLQYRTISYQSWPLLGEVYVHQYKSQKCIP